jgi:L-ascorbate metabolism protein UlaG (beta-lactamase superfamily)
MNLINSHNNFYPKIIAIAYLVLTGYIFGYAQNPGKPGNLQVTYIANEGFMLKSQHHKILIDALFSEGYNYFDYPSPEVTNKILSSTAPFDSIGLCFITHYHKDHSDSKLIREYLSKYPSVKLVTTRPSLVFIDGEEFGFIKLKGQFCEITPETNKYIDRTINDIPVKVLGLKHMSFYQDGYNLEEYMTNVGFYINLDGIRVFHSGDTKMENFREFMIKNKSLKVPVDIAFVNYELLNEGKTDLNFLIKTLNPKHIVVMHVPPSIYDIWANKVGQLKQIFPNIILFKKSLDNQTIEL